MASFKELTQAVNRYQATGKPSGEIISSQEAVMPELDSPEEGFEIDNIQPVPEQTTPRAIDILRNAGRINGLVGSESYFNSALESGWGDKPRYDRQTGYTPGNDVEEERALAQPAVWKIGNGIVKGGITAAVTAANTVAGTVYGAGAAMFDLHKQMLSNMNVFKSTPYSIGQTLDAGVNNWVSQRLMDVQNWSEEAFPNYRTAEERSDKYQRQWLRHVLTPNFIGDSLIKNFGFTVGAIGGGAVWSNLMSKAMSARLVNDIMKGATVAAEGDAVAIKELMEAAQAIPKGAQVTVDASKFAGNLKRAARQINSAGSRLQIYGAALGAMGEGSMEGLMAKKEYLDEQIPLIRQEYMSMLKEAEDDILYSDNTDLYDIIPVMNEDGTVGEKRVLTLAGRQELFKRQQVLQDAYERRLGGVEKLGDRLATITYGLNFPLLTASNTIEFAKMFSGGWKTARTIRGVNGAAGSYRGLLSGMSEKAAIRTMATINSIKNGGTEAFEEMAQGFISSGLKGSASNLLTQYNDDGFDDRATDSMREWLGDMWPEGKEYLSDPKNWQEGFLGALTGLFGIPGRGYFSGERGGIPGAIADARRQVTESRAAADKLNTIVNGSDFQDRWRSYIRHLKYDNDMEDALASDDKKAWTDANEKQIISDIMAFAKAGKLDDMRQLAQEYMSKSEADAADIRDVQEGNDPAKQVVTKNKSDKEIVDEVVERATKLNDSIKEYSDIYDALLTLAPANYSDKLLEELVFTVMNIKSVERRYLSMLNKDLADAESSIATVAGKGAETDEEKTIATSKLKADLERAFSSMLPGGSNEEIRKQSKQIVANLRKKIGDSDKNLTKILDDMSSISNDRYALYNKYQKLLSGEAAKEYEKQAETQEKKQEKNTKKQVKAEAQGYKTIDDVKASYRDLVQSRGLATEFFQQLTELSQTSKPARDFLELHETSTDFRAFYEDNGLSLSEDLQTAKTAEKLILDRMFDDAQTKQQYLDFAFNFDSYREDGTVIPGGRIKTPLSAVTGPTIESMSGIDILGRAYQQALDSIKNSLEEYKKVSNYVSGRSRQTPKQSGSGNLNAPTLASMSGGKKMTPPTLAGMTGKQASQVEEEQEPESHKDALGRDWAVGQKVYMYKLDSEGEITPVFVNEYTIQGFYKGGTGNKMRLVDDEGHRTIVDLDKSDVARLSPVKQESYEPAEDDTAVIVTNQAKTGGTAEVLKTTVVDDLTEEEEQQIGDEETVNEGGPKHYYRTGMPEVSSFKASDIRKILKNRNLTLREKLTAIFKTHLRDFYLEDEAYRPTWQMLSNFKRTGADADEEAQNAFYNTATVATVGDKVEFRIDPKFSILDADGNPQILVYTVKDGKSYLLSTLGYNTSRTEYENITDLRNAILEQYRKQEDKSKEFVFTDESTGQPYQSTIWSKRNGIVIYNENTKESGYVQEKPIKDIPGYDSNAPIVFINKTGEQVQLSGAPYNNAYLSSLSDDPECHGNLYYLAKGKDGYCIPIRLNVEHFRKETAGYSNPVFTNIRSAVKEVAKTASEILNSPIEDLHAANSTLSGTVQTLGRYLDIHNYIFRILQKRDGTYVLRVYVNGNSGNQAWFGPSDISEERFSDYIAAQKLPVNIGETTNVNSLVNSDILTSNAQALWAKGTDIYYYRWTGNGFEPYATQDKISESGSAPAEEELPEGTRPTREDIRRAVSEKKARAAAVPTERNVSESEGSLESKLREILGGKVGEQDIESVVKGLQIAISSGKASRLLDGIRRFNSSPNSEESEKAFTYILGAVTLKSERDALRESISKDAGIPVSDITTYEMFDRYVSREDDDELMNRIANLVAYSNFVNEAISALSGNNNTARVPENPNQEQGAGDIRSELASIDYNTITFEGLSKSLKKILVDSGCDADTFDSLSPDGKKSALGCLGI